MFDAVIGNPPFLGGHRITGLLGTDYRAHLVNTIARGRKGSADLSAYFLLRAHDLVGEHGQVGIVATNTLGQGATQRVGLAALVADGVTIRTALKSAPWPGRAAVQFCIVITTKGAMDSGRCVIWSLPANPPGVALWALYSGSGATPGRRRGPRIGAIRRM